MDPLGRQPGRMDFREAMDWAKTIWKTIEYPSNRGRVGGEDTPRTFVFVGIVQSGPPAELVA